MIDFEVDIDTRQAEVFVRGVNLEVVPIAEVRALNKVIVTVRKETGNEIYKRRRIKKGEIRKQLTIIRATKQTFEARVRASRKPISLKQYDAKLAGRQGNKRVTVNVTGEKQLLEHAFILGAGGGIGGGHVFERVGPTPLPIRKLFGPSLGSAIVAPAVQQAMRQVVRAKWPAVIEREIAYELTKLEKKARRA